MKAIPAAVRDSLEAARYWRRARGGRPSRMETRRILFVVFGYSREERIQLRRETARALEAARRGEGALLARWGVAP